MKSTSLICLLLSIISIEIPNSFADGGQVQFQQTSGFCIITLFTPTSVLHSGRIDLSVMVQNLDNGNPITDAIVKMYLRSDKGSLIQSDVPRQSASNRLLYTTIMDVPSPGSWYVKIDVRRGADVCSAFGEIEVQPAGTVLGKYAIYIVFPLVAITLFALHQWLKQQKNRST